MLQKNAKLTSQKEKKKGKVLARVQGRRNTPYKVEIRISPLSEMRIQDAISKCGRKIENLDRLIKGDFPEELQQKAGSLFGFSEITSAFRLEMAAEIIDSLFEAFNEDKQKIMSEYKENSCVIGKTVEIITATETYSAKAIDITPNGELVVEKDDSSCVQLNSGEISLKLF